METVVSTKGQVVIPKEIRERLHIGAGTRLEIEECEHGIVFRVIGGAPAYSVDDLLALPRRYRGPRRTVADMNAALDADVRSRWSKT